MNLYGNIHSIAEPAVATVEGAAAHRYRAWFA